jgi:hypothetical protein
MSAMTDDDNGIPLHICHNLQKWGVYEDHFRSRIERVPGTICHPAIASTNDVVNNDD